MRGGRGGGGGSYSYSSPGQGSGERGGRQREGNRGGGGDRQRSGGGSGGGSSGRRGGRNNSAGNNNKNRDNDYSRLPLERGLVCTLKESFGFIYCADRPEELFFHYSQVQGIHPADLKIDDAVEFRVSGGGGSNSRSNSTGQQQQQQQQQTDSNARRAAVMVRTLPPGETIVWETHDEPNCKFRGLVERSARSSRGGRSNSSSETAAVVDGTIRLLEEKEQTQEAESDNDVANNDKKDKESSSGSTPGNVTASATGPLIRFRANAYKPRATPAAEVVAPSPVPGTNSRSQGLQTPQKQQQQQQSILRRGDLVEFELWTERRTGDKYAKNLTLLQSEKELARLAQEEQMLKDATIEHGIITSLKGGYGFLKSNKRREEVYFHYSSIHLVDDTTSDTVKDGADVCNDEKNSTGVSDGSDTNADGGVNEEMILKEGQEMKFLVVTETSSPVASGSGGRNRGDSATSGGSKRRVSARRVQMQPRGSVKFHDVVARGVTGTVSVPPQPVDASHTLDMHGRVRLAQPIILNSQTDESGSDSNGTSPKVVTEVFLSSKDSPGGSYSFHGGSSVGMWIQQGDTLLFDVVQDFVDGSCHASPTRYLTPRKVEEGENANEPTDDNDDDVLSEDPPAVRLIDLALAMRAEGVVNAVKEAYGFLHYSERPVDVHFKLYQVLPDNLQTDIRRNLGISQVDDRGRKLRLGVGAEVSFDLSVHGTIHSHAERGFRGGGNGRNANQQERENLKAQRVLLLPKHSIQLSKTLAKDLGGVVTKVEVKNPYCGGIDLEEVLQPMSLDERHPLVARMVDQYLELCNESSRNNSAPPEPIVFHDIQTLKEDDVVLEMLERKARGVLTHSFLPPPEQEAHYNGRFVIQPVSNNDTTSSDKPQTAQEGAQQQSPAEDTMNETTATPSGISSEEATASAPQTIVDAKQVTATNTPSTKHRGKKKNKVAKPINALRYDKGSLCPELKSDLPLTAGDVVAVDVVQSRRTGAISISNMRLVERKTPVESVLGAQVSSSTQGMGIVAEVVAARNFGFITLLDETATKREMLFFHLSSIAGASKGSETGGKSVPSIRKGDEVRFNLGKEKNGKRVALNVTLLPKGTIPSKADKNACRGIILLEPTHTTLKNTPLRHAASTASQQNSHPAGGGLSRWHSTGDDKATQKEPIMEQGCVLLISDPTDMFSSQAPQEQPVVEKKDSSTASEGPPTTSDSPAVVDNTEAVTPTEAITAVEPESTPTNATAKATWLNKHLRFKQGSIAIHGPGSSSLTDNSSNPKRGDIVSFVKTRNGKGVRDMRVVSRGGATLLRGKLNDIQPNDDSVSGSATFVAATDNQEKYPASLSEVISCEASVLKENEVVEAVLHEGSIYGICRTVDLYLDSKLSSAGAVGGIGQGGGARQRPKLNLTVKKDRGGTIMAQSMMAKGPDGTDGFAPGWTNRISSYTKQEPVLSATHSTTEEGLQGQDATEVIATGEVTVTEIAVESPDSTTGEE